MRYCTWPFSSLIYTATTFTRGYYERHAYQALIAEAHGQSARPFRIDGRTEAHFTQATAHLQNGDAEVMISSNSGIMKKHLE